MIGLVASQSSSPAAFGFDRADDSSSRAAEEEPWRANSWSAAVMACSGVPEAAIQDGCVHAEMSG